MKVRSELLCRKWMWTEGFFICNALTHQLVTLSYVTAVQGVKLSEYCHILAKNEHNFKTLNATQNIHMNLILTSWLPWFCVPLGTDGATRGGERQSHRGFGLWAHPEQPVSIISKRNMHAQCGRWICGLDCDLWEMSWMLSIWVAAALLPLCWGQNTVHEGRPLRRWRINIKLMYFVTAECSFMRMYASHFACFHLFLTCLMSQVIDMHYVTTLWIYGALLMTNLKCKIWICNL